MKRVRQFLVLVLVVFVFSCTSDGDNPLPDGPSAQEQVREDLSASTWEASAVKRENQDVSSDYNEFKLDFNASGTYSTENGGNAWNSNGSWKFADNQTTTRILLDNEVLVDIALNGNSLRLNFSIDEDVFGRTKTVSADYEFSLNR